MTENLENRPQIEVYTQFNLAYVLFEPETELEARTRLLNLIKAQPNSDIPAIKVICSASQVEAVEIRGISNLLGPNLKDVEILETLIRLAITTKNKYEGKKST